MSYMIYVDGQSPPSKEHETVEEARTEAERLSPKYGDRKIFVLAVIDVLIPTRQHSWRSEEPK
jgi:hypothetical protein